MELRLKHGAAVLTTSGNTGPGGGPDQQHLPLLVAVQGTQKLPETILSVDSKSLRGPRVY